MAIPARVVDFLRGVSTEILDAQKPLRVIRALDWPDEVEQEFFGHGAASLPKPSYAVPPGVADALVTLQALGHRLKGENEIERFLCRTCDSLATAARMLLSIGTRDFYHHSVELYGKPTGLSSDRRTTNLDLARHFEEVIAAFPALPSPEDEASLDAESAAGLLRERFARFFGAQPVKVKVVERLAGTASSTAAEIRLKRDVRYSPRDVRQIDAHEGQVHMATTLNGRAQPIVPFIAVPSPRAARTQEGLAVFTEFVTGSICLPRVRRLCDRTFAIHMAEQGASFVDIYRYFRERGHDEHAAFDCARRVVRGGLVEGGAPFTKDGCYLDGFLRVTNFLRIALTRGQSRLVPLLFVGKLAVDDVALFARLAREGVLADPNHVPAWAKDLSFLTAFMSYTAFRGRRDLGTEQRRLEDQLARAEEELG